MCFTKLFFSSVYICILSTIIGFNTGIKQPTIPIQLVLGTHVLICDRDNQREHDDMNMIDEGLGF
jgi:hypothetical protein